MSDKPQPIPSSDQPIPAAPEGEPISQRNLGTFLLSTIDNAFQDGLSAAVGYGVAKGLDRLTGGKGDGSPPAGPPAAS
jgi:hypothetical protein